jgi:hypothetical protein
LTAASPPDKQPAPADASSPLGLGEGPAKHQLWLKLAALALVIAALALPINDLFRYALLVVSTVLIFTGIVSTRRKPWIGAAAAVGLCVLGHVMLAVPRIEEGHNVFLVDGPGGALEAGLPTAAFRLMAAEFDARYPPERRCDRAVPHCWRQQGFPDRPFAFSADGIFDRPAYSRRVTGIAFADPVWLRLGFINELRYNWNSLVSDIDRSSRDRRFWAVVHRWKLEMPWFVMYRFPAEFVGSAVCWRGDVLWEGVGGDFAAIHRPSMACRTLAADDAGRRIFGVAIRQDPPLAMRLDPTAKIRLWQLLEPALALAGCAAVLGLLLRVRLRRTIVPFTFIALALVVAFFTEADFIGGVHPFDGGDDGLAYDGYARAMLQHLLAGDTVRALEGEEKVFFLTPGTRYLRALEHVIFGESYLGYLALMLALPLLVLAMFRRFLPPRWALALALIFAAIPTGVVFGSSLVLYIKWAARGFGDPAAYVLFLSGFVLLVGRADTGPRDRFASALGAGLSFALALFVRPNLAPAAGILLGGAGLAALWQRQFRRLAGMCLGFLPVLGMALHNWAYGGVFVLFTSTADHHTTLVMPPSAYLAALSELLRFDLSGEHVARAVKQIGGWLSGPSESVIVAPLHVAALVVLVRVALWKIADPWLRLTAWALLVQHCVGIFYATAGRYYYLTWLLTLLVVAAWLQREGIGWLQRRFPVLAERVARHRLGVALARGLTSMARDMEATPAARRAAT